MSGFSSWRGLTPLPVVIRLSTAKTAPITISACVDSPLKWPSARKANSVANDMTASGSWLGNTCRKHLAAIELPHRHEIGDVEECGEAGQRGEHARDQRIAGADREIAAGDGDRDDEGREARAHQRNEGDLEAAVVRTPADGDAAEQRDEDHAHACDVP